jgi:hypothetical protein
MEPIKEMPYRYKSIGLDLSQRSINGRNRVLIKSYDQRNEDTIEQVT